jgi:hypothetical protein
MRNVLWIASAAALLLTSTAWAAPCVAVTYDNYKAGGFTCTVGALTFSNFTSTFTNAHDLSNAAITDANVSVTIINAGGLLGLQFSLGSGMAVRDNGTGAQTGQAQFGFTVSGAPLAFAKITIAGNRDGTGTNATYSADVSGTTLSTDVANQILSDQQPLPGPPNTVTVADDARATIPGGNLQQAQIQSISDAFSVAPEPCTIAGLFVGSIALLVLGHSQKASRGIL